MARILMILAALSIWAVPHISQARNVALVLGNSAYAKAGNLDNPAKDAALVTAALEEAGFETIIAGSDASQDDMLARLPSFRELADGAKTALIYFAGHGIEAKGKNWLIPTDAGLKRANDLPYEAVELQLAMEALEGAQLRIAVLDACRDNPFSRQWNGETRAVIRGVAPVEMDDVLVIYAAAPGMVAFDGDGENSPFAASLARRIVQPGLPVQMLGGMVRDDVLRATDGEQRPFISASITGRPIYIVGGPDARGIAGPAAEIDPAGGARQDADLAAWEAALKLDTVDGYRAYLNARPGCAFTAMADANVAQLLDPAALGGKLKPSAPGLFGFSTLPNRYDIDRGPSLPIDGVWRLSTNGKRLRIEGGRVFAVDSWVHLIVARVYSDQVVMKDLTRSGPGIYEARDILINGEAALTLRADGNLDVRVAAFPIPASFKLIREGMDDSAAFTNELSNRSDQ